MQGDEPAFPIKGYCADASGALCGEVIAHPGLTKREWFAAMATEEDIGEFMPPTVGRAQEFESVHGFPATRWWARFQHADAMIEASKRKEAPGEKS